MTGRRRPPRYPGGRSKDFADEPLLSEEEVTRRINVEGGGQLQQPPPEHKFRDRRPTPAVRRARGGRSGARDSLFLVGLVIVGLIAVGVLLPEGPLTASASDEPSQGPSGVAAASASARASGAAPTAVLITLPPGSAGPSEPPATAAPTPPPTTAPATQPPGPGATSRPSATPRVTTTPTKAPTQPPATQPPTATLVVRVTVVNDDGGNRSSSAWTVSVSSAGGASPSSFGGSAVGTSVTIGANATYSVSAAAGPDGYSSSPTADCSSATGGLPAPGSTQTCTIVKNDIKPRLTVRTIVDNDAGGSQSAADWTVTVTGTDVVPGSFAGSSSGVVVRVNANAPYSVAMSNPNDEDYVEGMSGTCSGSGLAVGADVTCTFTYTYTPPPAPATGVIPLAPLALAALLGGRRWIRRRT